LQSISDEYNIKSFAKHELKISPVLYEFLGKTHEMWRSDGHFENRESDDNEKKYYKQL